MRREEYPKGVDCRGVRIKLGDTIVYPVRRGSIMTLKEAVVCEVPGRGCDVRKGVVALNPKGRRIILETTSRCAVVSDFVNDRRKRDADI